MNVTTGPGTSSGSGHLVLRSADAVGEGESGALDLVLHVAVPPALVAQVLVQVVSFVLLQGALPLRHQVRAIC